MTCDSLQERAGRGLSDDTNHVAVRAHGEATEANKDRRHQNLSAPDILIFNTHFPPPKMYECARLQNVRVGEICVKTTSPRQTDAREHARRRRPSRGPPMRCPPHARRSRHPSWRLLPLQWAKKKKKSTNSNIGFHIGYSVCQPNRTSGAHWPISR